MTRSDEVPNDNIKPDKSIEEPNTRSSLIKTVIILAAVIAVVIIVEVVLEYKLHGRYKTILRIAEVVAVGYFASTTISNACYKLTFGFLGKNAEALRVLIRIVGAVIIIAIIISYLSQDPLVAIHWYRYGNCYRFCKSKYFGEYNCRTISCHHKTI